MLATRFSKTRSRTLSAPMGEALDESRLRALVPSIFAPQAHESRSDRYTYLPTIDVVRGLAGEGFQPVFACQAVPRDGDRLDFAKHMIRFRHADTNSPALRGETPEVVMINSHDGSTSYQLFSGVFRFICTNGMVAGEKFGECRVKHSGDVVAEVIEAAISITRDFRPMLATVQEWKTIDLKPAEQEAFAEGAAILRFDLADGEKSPVSPRALLAPRRYGDDGADLWSTLNRVQENTIRGGISGLRIGDAGRRRRMTTRPVGGIDQNVGLNRALWRMTELMAEMKAA